MSDFASSPLPSQNFPLSSQVTDYRLDDTSQHTNQDSFFGGTTSDGRARNPSSSHTNNNGPPAGVNSAEANDTAAEAARQIRVNRNVSTIPKVSDQISEAAQLAFEQFLETFTLDENDEDYDADFGGKVYLARIAKMAHNDSTLMNIDFQHLLNYENGILAAAITDEFYRILPYLQNGLRKVVATHQPQYLRLQSSSLISDDTTKSVERDFQLSFYNLLTIHRIRELKSENIGVLMAISGTVTRTSEIRPELYKAAFTCDLCKALITNVEQTFKYTEPTSCINNACLNQSEWTLNISKSHFLDWQKVRVQENSNEIPNGSMPRTLDIILRGELVDKAKPGDKCKFTGTEIVIPDISQYQLPGVRAASIRMRGNGNSDGLSSGISMRSLGARDLTYKIAFLCCHVSSMTGKSLDNDTDDRNKAADNFLSKLTDSEVFELRTMVSNANIYSNLIQSICPTVYGHEYVKKGVLLQLLGGLHKKTVEGINLRGDINVCIVGDPSCAKSQFLKWVTSFAQRAVYTSGKASSAAGLTASVVKDEESGEFTIEAGALMLADNGICCIDEFDKMDISDQVAIHEAMEQQTISIAKAGIHATLNARTSILAAANPIGGRYNPKVGLRSNLSMTGPILSRFDLFFVILDECNEEIDTRLAEHIVNLHLFRDAAIDPPYTKEQVLRYINYAKLVKPKMSSEARHYLIERYKDLRANDGETGRSSYRITVRQLESLIRLSEAIARANCKDIITTEFVDEAYDLLKKSIISVEKDDLEINDDDEDNEDEDEDNGDNAEPSTDAPGDVNNGNEMLDEDHEDIRGYTGNGEEKPQTKKSSNISYNDFIKLRNLFLKHIKSVEENAARVAEEQTDEIESDEIIRGVTQNNLIDWFMVQIEDELNSESEYYAQRKLAKKVLHKLVKDNILMRVNPDPDSFDQDMLPDNLVITSSMNETEIKEMQEKQQEWMKKKNKELNKKLVYIVHPNCSLEDLFGEVDSDNEIDVEN